MRVKVGEQRRDIGLGAYPTISLTEARQRARDIHDEIRSGHSPIAPRKLQQATLAAKAAADRSFGWCADEYVRAKSAEWSNPKHRQQWENTLKTYVFPHLENVSVSAVDLPHVLACLEPIWSTKNETASRLRGRIETILDWATVRKYRHGENPARWKGHLDKVLAAPSKVKVVEHHRAVAVDTIGGFMRDLKVREGLAARALEFLILTAARSGEVRGATWSEINFSTCVWTVPGIRMKAGNEHRVPLSDAAMALLRSVPVVEGCELIFPGTRGQPLSDMTMSAVMRRMKIDAVPHGFRSTFRDWVGEKTHHPRELAEQALAHTLESKVEAAYRRGDGLEKRRRMMQDWADYIAQS